MKIEDIRAKLAYFDYRPGDLIRPDHLILNIKEVLSDVLNKIEELESENGDA